MNEIRDHKQELRSSNELLANLHESGRNEEGKETRSHKETWAAPSTKETGADPVILTPRASQFTNRTIDTNEKKSINIHAHSRYGGVLAVSVSKLATTMLRHYDLDERQRGDIGPVLVGAFARGGARGFDDGYWLRLIHECSTKKTLEYCQDKDGFFLCFLRAIQGHSGGIPISPEMMEYTLVPVDWKKYFVSQRKSMGFSLGSGEWNHSRRRRGGQSSSSCLSDTLKPFGKDQEEEKPHSDYTVPQKAPYET